MDSLLGTLFINLTAQNATFLRNVKDSQEAMGKASESIAKSAEFAKKSLEVLGIAFGIHEIKDFIKDTLEATDHLKKFSEEIGGAIEEVAGLKFAADKANVGDVFEQGFRKFSSAMREAQVEGSKMQFLFRTMGVTETQDVAKAFNQVANTVKGYNDGVEKLGLVEELFGTRNSRFVSLLNAGSEGIKEQSDLFNKLTGVDMKEAATMSEEYNDSVTDLVTSLRGLALILMRDLVPALTKINEFLAENSAALRDDVRDWGKVAAVISETVLPVLRALIALDREFKTALGKAGKATMDFFGAGDIEAGLMAGSKDVSTALQKSFGEVRKTLEDEHKKNAPNIAKLNEDFQAIQSLMGRGKGGLGRDPAAGLRRDIAGLSGIEGLPQSVDLKEQMADAQRQLTELDRLGKTQYAQEESVQKKILEMKNLYREKEHALVMAQNVLILDTLQKTSESILSITETWAGKQSGIYTAMFAVSKAFAIAEATVKIAQGIAAAAAGVFPENLIAMASVAAATANIVSSIQAVKLQFAGSRAMGGSVEAGKMYMVGERGPESFIPSQSGNILPNGSGGMNVVVNNYTDATVSTSQRESGGERFIEVMVRRMKKEIGSEIRDGKGEVNRAMQDTFRLQRGGR